VEDGARTYVLRKQLWAYTHNRIAVTFQYEWHDAGGQWWRSHGNEMWQFDDGGYMSHREASVNDVRIDEIDRRPGMTPSTNVRCDAGRRDLALPREVTLAARCSTRPVDQWGIPGGRGSCTSPGHEGC
jgi:nuclear transport factor 2 (NTF2) superfamily protein